MNAISLTALVAFISSTFGALILLTPIERFGRRFQAGSMGFCAGVMLGAAVFSLILPGVRSLAEVNGLSVASAILMGALFMEVLHRFTPHEHYSKGHEGPQTRKPQRVFLVVAAIALHNFPEGLSLGSGYMQPDTKAALSLLIGISVQNVPEGLLVAVSLLSAGASRSQALMGVVTCGLVEAVGAVLGSYFGLRFEGLLPWCLLISSGAMIYVVSQEMIPESHGYGFEGLATFSILIGFVGMLVMSLPN